MLLFKKQFLMLETVSTVYISACVKILNLCPIRPIHANLELSPTDQGPNGAQAVHQDIRLPNE